MDDKFAHCKICTIDENDFTLGNIEEMAPKKFNDEDIEIEIEDVIKFKKIDRNNNTEIMTFLIEYFQLQGISEPKIFNNFYGGSPDDNYIYQLWYVEFLNDGYPNGRKKNNISTIIALDENKFIYGKTFLTKCKINPSYVAEYEDIFLYDVINLIKVNFIRRGVSILADGTLSTFQYVHSVSEVIANDMKYLKLIELEMLGNIVSMYIYDTKFETETNTKLEFNEIATTLFDDKNIFGNVYVFVRSTEGRYKDMNIQTLKYVTGLVSKFSKKNKKFLNFDKLNLEEFNPKKDDLITTFYLLIKKEFYKAFKDEDNFYIKKKFDLSLPSLNSSIEKLNEYDSFSLGQYNKQKLHDEFVKKEAEDKLKKEQEEQKKLQESKANNDEDENIENIIIDDSNETKNDPAYECDDKQILENSDYIDEDDDIMDEIIINSDEEDSFNGEEEETDRQNILNMSSEEKYNNDEDDDEEEKEPSLGFGSLNIESLMQKEWTKEELDEMYKKNQAKIQKIIEENTK